MSVSTGIVHTEEPQDFDMPGVWLDVIAWRTAKDHKKEKIALNITKSELEKDIATRNAEIARLEHENAGEIEGRNSGNGNDAERHAEIRRRVAETTARCPNERRVDPL